MPTAIYPWEDWISRLRKEETIELVKGEDFDVNPYIFTQQIRNYVTRMNKGRKKRSQLRIRISTEENIVTIYPRP